MDIYVGPNAPKGFENNWIPSVPGKSWFSYFRLYDRSSTKFYKCLYNSNLSSEIDFCSDPEHRRRVPPREERIDDL